MVQTVELFDLPKSTNSKGRLFPGVGWQLNEKIAFMYKDNDYKEWVPFQQQFKTLKMLIFNITMWKIIFNSYRIWIRNIQNMLSSIVYWNVSKYVKNDNKRILLIKSK